MHMVYPDKNSGQRVPAATQVAAAMMERVPDADQREVMRAARALALSFGGQWSERCQASEFWANSVRVNVLLMSDTPF